MIWRPTAQASRLCDALRLRATGRGWRMSTTPATAALHVQRFLAECPSCLLYTSDAADDLYTV